MSRIRSQNTIPELFVRSLLHRAGYRYRLHVRELPGSPDIVFPKYKAVIEVRGCFWHNHFSCPNAKLPETRREWWERKISLNVLRDQCNVTLLQNTGWKVIVVWTCLIKKALKNPLLSKAILESFKDCFVSNIAFFDINDMLLAKGYAIK